MDKRTRRKMAGAQAPNEMEKEIAELTRSSLEEENHLYVRLVVYEGVYARVCASMCSSLEGALRNLRARKNQEPSEARTEVALSSLSPRSSASTSVNALLLFFSLLLSASSFLPFLPSLPSQFSPNYSIHVLSGSLHI